MRNVWLIYYDHELEESKEQVTLERVAGLRCQAAAKLLWPLMSRQEWGCFRELTGASACVHFKFGPQPQHPQFLQILSSTSCNSNIRIWYSFLHKVEVWKIQDWAQCYAIPISPTAPKSNSCQAPIATKMPTTGWLILVGISKIHNKAATTTHWRAGDSSASESHRCLANGNVVEKKGRKIWIGCEESKKIRHSIMPSHCRFRLNLDSWAWSILVQFFGWSKDFLSTSTKNYGLRNNHF